ETADAELGARDAGHEDPVRDLGGAGDRETVLPVRDLRLPHLLAGLRVERDDVCVERAAINLAVVDRDAFGRLAAAHHARHLRVEADRSAPQLLAAVAIDRA